MEIWDRFHAIRRQKKLTQPEMAAIIGVEKSTWSKLEQSNEKRIKGLPFDKLEKLFRDGKIDPRFIFGLSGYESAEKADLEKHPLSKIDYNELLEKNPLLKELILKLIDAPNDILESCIDAASFDDEKIKRHIAKFRKAGNQ